MHRGSRRPSPHVRSPLPRSRSRSGLMWGGVWGWAGAGSGREMGFDGGGGMGVGWGGHETGVKFQMSSATENAAHSHPPSRHTSSSQDSRQQLPLDTAGRCNTSRRNNKKLEPMILPQAPMITFYCDSPKKSAVHMHTTNTFAQTINMGGEHRRLA